MSRALRGLGLLLAGVAALGQAALAMAAAASPRPDASVEVYRRSAAAGAVGTVTGVAYAERRKPDASDQPMSGVAVVMVPRSEAFLARLTEIKGGSRASVFAFRVLAAAVRTAREAYEQALADAGALDLILGTVADGTGRFELTGVPEGAWLLVATHSVFVPKPSKQPTKRERGTFERAPRLTGFDAVTVWVREVTVRAGERVAVELTDRNGWVSGVIEETTTDAGR